MGEKYAKYVITDPRLVTELAHHNFDEISGYTFPDPVYLDRDVLREADTWLDIVWLWDPHPPDLLGAHSHPFDEIVLLVGSDPKDLFTFGGSEIEWFMGEGEDAERFLIDKTCAIYIPRGLVHGPMNFPRMVKPVLNIAIGLNSGEYQ